MLTFDLSDGTRLRIGFNLSGGGALTLRQEKPGPGPQAPEIQVPFADLKAVKEGVQKLLKVWG